MSGLTPIKILMFDDEDSCSIVPSATQHVDLALHGLIDTNLFISGKVKATLSLPILFRAILSLPSPSKPRFPIDLIPDKGWLDAKRHNSMIRKSRHSWHIFQPILAGASLMDRLIACVGALVGIGLTAIVCSTIVGSMSLPWLVAPLGASAVLLFAVPASPLAQPWSIIGGNVISAMVGVAAAQWITPLSLAAGIAVGGAIFAMSVFRCLHPPGGAAALTAVIGGKSVAALGLLFPFIPMGVNSLLLVLIGLAFHRFSGHSYPHRSVPAAGHSIKKSTSFDVQAADIDLALADVGETFDIGREDLELIFRRVEHHAHERRISHL